MQVAELLLSLFVVLTVIIFMTAKASGGVLNPSVALMLFIVGEITWIKAAGFAVVQVSGAACGALVASVIDIGYSYGSWDVNHAGPGCGPVEVDAKHYAPIFVWEFLGTFILVSRPAQELERVRLPPPRAGRHLLGRTRLSARLPSPSPALATSRRSPSVPQSL